MVTDEVDVGLNVFKGINKRLQAQTIQFWFVVLVDGGWVGARYLC
jgi:hypothetical protein